MAFDGSGGMRVAWVWRLHKTYKTYKIMVGAPVFALTGYAAASHVIPRGFAGRSLGLLRVQICRWVTHKFLIPAEDCRIRGGGAVKKNTESSESSENTVKMVRRQIKLVGNRS